LFKRADCTLVAAPGTIILPDEIITVPQRFFQTMVDLRRTSASPRRSRHREASRRCRDRPLHGRRRAPAFRL
jgi:hypothetical protein